jgi:hypothetical protein
VQALGGEAVLFKAGEFWSLLRNKSSRGVRTKAIKWLSGFMSSSGSFNAQPASGVRNAAMHPAGQGKLRLLQDDARVLPQTGRHEKLNDERGIKPLLVRNV